jgi:predicted RNA-binding Zn-ribbon protein involved in translation (DUF1610 family)
MVEPLSKDLVFTCPACKSHDGVRDEADIGVGIQYGPWHCQSCGWGESTACPVCGQESCRCNEVEGIP